MACFPFFIELSGKNCLVVGGGEVAYRKLNSLLEFGVRAHLVSPEICGEIWQLRKAYSKNELLLSEREYTDEDFKDVFLVIAATDDTECNRCVSEICRKRHILVNVVDCKELCDFYFPAVIKCRDLVVGISSGGKSPLLAGRLRRELKEAMPEYYGEINEQLGKLRERIQREIPSGEARKGCLEEMMEQCRRVERILYAEEVEEIIERFSEEARSRK